MEYQEEIRNKSFKLNKNDFTRDGYDFLGWAKNQEATEPEYQDEDTVAFSDNTTLYAIWKHKSYSGAWHFSGEVGVFYCYEQLGRGFRFNNIEINIMGIKDPNEPLWEFKDKIGSEKIIHDFIFSIDDTDDNFIMATLYYNSTCSDSRYNDEFKMTQKFDKNLKTIRIYLPNTQIASERKKYLDEHKEISILKWTAPTKQSSYLPWCDITMEYRND